MALANAIITKLGRQAELSQLELTDLEALAARARWKRKARPNQLGPTKGNLDTWRVWLCKAGRGWGKTRTEVEWAWWQLYRDPGTVLHVVARTHDDLKKTLFEGPSGFFNIIPKALVIDRKKNPYEMTLYNGSKILSFSADTPASLRGPEAQYAICDEFAFWKYREEAWSNLNLGLRIGSPSGRPSPRIVVATTPLPVKELRDMLEEVKTPTSDIGLSEGATFDNTALDKGTLMFFRKKYEGTRLGRQELYGEVLDDIIGALWTWKLIEKARSRDVNAPDAQRRVVAVDPAGSKNKDSDETGIIVCQRDRRSDTGSVMADRSAQASPAEWGRAVVEAYDEFQCDEVVAEVNNGGDMVEHVIRSSADAMFAKGERKNKEIKVRKVHATRGKIIRAEPVAALYEQGRIKHYGDLGECEKQLCTWSPLTDEGSPDRLDALVWGLTACMLDLREAKQGRIPSDFGASISSWSPS